MKQTSSGAARRRWWQSAALWALCGVLFAVAPAWAADANGLPRIQIVHAGADALLADTEDLMKLAGKQGEETWPIVRDTLGIFLVGIDTRRPLRVDVVLQTGGSVRQVWYVPVEDIDTFLNENLAGIGFETKKLEDRLWRYNLSGAEVEGFLRHVHGYAVLSSNREDVAAELPDPAPAAKKLLADGAALAIHVENPPDSQQKRREAIQSLRREALAALKQGTQETPAQFALRKTLLERALIEAERLLAESKSLTVRWKLQTGNSQAPGVTRLTLLPIEGTSLHEAIAALGEEPSRFDAWEAAADSALYLLVNHPLDALRKEHATAVLDALQPVLKEQIDQSQRGEEERESLTAALEAFHALLRDTAKAGLADSVIDVRRNADGTFRLVGGVRSPNGHRFDEILKRWVAGRAGRSVETLNRKEFQDADIHVFSLAFTDSERADIAKVLGSDTTVLIATAKEAVWYAAGAGSEDSLKAIIAATRRPAEDSDGDADRGRSDIVRGVVSVKPWLELRRKLFPRSEAENDAAATPEQRQRQILLASLRKHVQETLTAENGRIRFRLRRDGDGVAGESIVHIGLLTVLGKFVTQYAAENLQ